MPSILWNVVLRVVGRNLYGKKKLIPAMISKMLEVLEAISRTENNDIDP